MDSIDKKPDAIEVGRAYYHDRIMRCLVCPSEPDAVVYLDHEGFRMHLRLCKVHAWDLRDKLAKRMATPEPDLPAPAKEET